MIGEAVSNHQALGIAAAVVSFASFAIYVASILHGATKPSRVTWWILGGLNAAIAASYYKSGATETIWLPIEFSVSFLIIGMLSIKYGDGRWAKMDSLCVMGGLVSLGAWWYYQSSQLGLILLTFVDFIGLAPTLVKAWLRPWTEDRIAWLIGTCAGGLNVLAIDRWTIWISAYPLYVFASSLTILLFLMRPHRSVVTYAH